MNVLDFIQKPEEQILYKKYDSLMRQDGVRAFNVVAFAKELGLECMESSELPLRVSGFIKKTDNRIVVCVNKFDSDGRKRFTIAHGIGHYFCHSDKLERGIVDGIGVTRDGTYNIIEHETSQVAAELLMPEDIFKAIWMDGAFTVDTIATLFAVSVSAALTRARLLKLLKGGWESYFG